MGSFFGFFLVNVYVVNYAGVFYWDVTQMFSVRITRNLN